MIKENKNSNGYNFSDAFYLNYFEAPTCGNAVGHSLAIFKGDEKDPYIAGDFTYFSFPIGVALRIEYQTAGKSASDSGAMVC